MGDTISGKITFDGRQPSIEDNLPWKTAINYDKLERKERMGDDLC